MSQTQMTIVCGQPLLYFVKCMLLTLLTRYSAIDMVGSIRILIEISIASRITFALIIIVSSMVVDVVVILILRFITIVIRLGINIILPICSRDSCYHKPSPYDGQYHHHHPHPIPRSRANVPPNSEIVSQRTSHKAHRLPKQRDRLPILPKSAEKVRNQTSQTTT